MNALSRIESTADLMKDQSVKQVTCRVTLWPYEGEPVPHTTNSLSEAVVWFIEHYEEGDLLIECFT
jgi:hypothetical protein